MFSKSKKSIPMKEETRGIPNINMISQGTEITGVLKTNTDIRISGKLDGTIESKGKVIISAGGFISGSVIGKEADVAGTIEGELVVSDKLVLRQTAVVKGDITTKSLLVEEGARFDGACKMSTEILNQNGKLSLKDVNAAKAANAK
jgi:cytoskeletal protein CcmA (bactofilin family)